jgi:hypothetical protein
MSYTNPKKVIKETTEKTMFNIKKRGHVFVEGIYENRESTLIVWCPTHNNEHSTNFYNYNRSRTGCPCCGSQQVSEKLINRQYSLETIEKMKISAKERPQRGGKPRRWRETTSYRYWRDSVFQEYNNGCAVTGIQRQKTGDLVVHHLYCAKENQDLIYVIENGIVLEKNLHTYFHKIYKFGGNTINQFQDFLLFILSEQEKTPFTLISSQANPERLEGSETRAYNPERVMKLHERLERVKEILTQNPL